MQACCLWKAKVTSTGKASLLKEWLGSSYSKSCFLNSKLKIAAPSCAPLRSSGTISFFAVKSPAWTCSQRSRPMKS